MAKVRPSCDQPRTEQNCWKEAVTTVRAESVRPHPARSLPDGLYPQRSGARLKGWRRAGRAAPEPGRLASPGADVRGSGLRPDRPAPRSGEGGAGAWRRFPARGNLKAAGVERVPMVLVDGKPAECCRAGAVTGAGLRAAGIGA